MSDFVAFDIETTGSDPFRHQLLCVGIGEKPYPADEGRRMARMLMVRPGTTIVAHTNYDLKWLMLDGARLGDGVHYHDTKVMAWLLDGTQPLDLASLTQRYCGYTPQKVLRMVQGRVMFQSATVGLVPIEETPWDELAAYNTSDLRAEADLYVALRGELRRTGRWHHFLAEEAPFSKLLVEMEATGMPFDREAAVDKLAITETELDRLERQLCALTGAPDFNPRSGPQVAQFLYTEYWEQETRFAIPRLAGLSAEEKAEKIHAITPPGVRVTKIGREYAYGTVFLDGMGLAPPRKKKKALTNRPSVSSKTLAVLYPENPWVADFVTWKKLDKLRGYLRDWIAREHNGRLHGRFDQSGTATGRLAAREPNLQQVASTGDIRDLFRGDLVVGDYGGLEVRLSAHFSKDPTMLELFRSGQDLYGVLASDALGGPADKTNEGRGLFKVVMLASQYGAGAEQIAEIFAVSGIRGYDAAKAGQLLKELERMLPRLFEWRREVIAQARKDGYVTTLAGRPRQLVGINSAHWEKQGQAERQAVNSVVQGSAADIVRRAMLELRRRVRPSVARICLQVHDELLLERGPGWSEECFPEIVEICETGHGFELDVPLVFEAKIAESWAAKGGSSGQVALGALEHLEVVRG